ncbi:MAG TPA: GNAT family N-acetyltransferase, partial [Rhodothermia bacterium]
MSGSDEHGGEIVVRAVGFEKMPELAAMNRILFEEERIINRFDRPDLVMLIAYAGDRPAGFKVGYGLDFGVYYSAKGGVLEPFRQRGIATVLLSRLMGEALSRGYRTYCFDTFPNKHTGMTVLALRRGFSVQEVRFSDVYRDLRVRFSTDLVR